MDQNSFIEEVAVSSGLDIKMVSKLVGNLSTIIEKCLEENDSIHIPGFGIFETRKRNERIMTHPSQPGKRLLVPPKIVVSFKPSSVLKNRLNQDNRSID